MKKIMIVGDACTDVFYYGTCDRIAPEAPVPILNIDKVIRSGGMAINVLSNVESLVKNSDTECFCLTNSNWEELTKERFVSYHTNHMLLRVDNDSGKYERIKNITNFNWEEYDAIIISDYNKGFLKEEDIEYISKRNKTVFLDTKKILGEWCKDVKYIKINSQEFKNTMSSLEHVPYLHEKLIVTMGSKGSRHKEKIYPAKEVEVKDVSGAGDSYLSGLVVEYLRTNDVEKAIKFATECATIVVQKRGVSVI